VPQPEAPKPEEAKKVEHTGPSPVVHYALAGIGTIIVMVLICVPARRG
jgi:L-asparagine transporter-like permease